MCETSTQVIPAHEFHFRCSVNCVPRDCSCLVGFREIPAEEQQQVFSKGFVPRLLKSGFNIPVCAPVATGWVLTVAQAVSRAVCHWAWGKSGGVAGAAGFGAGGPGQGQEQREGRRLPAFFAVLTALLELQVRAGDGSARLCITQAGFGVVPRHSSGGRAQASPRPVSWWRRSSTAEFECRRRATS